MPKASLPQIALPRKKKRVFVHPAWQRIFESFLASIANDTTRTQYERTLRRFFAFIAEKYPNKRAEHTPDKITQEDIEEFMRRPIQSGSRAGQPLSAFSHNSYLIALRAFYGYCEQAEIEFRGKMVPAIRKTPPTIHVKQRKTGDVERDFTDGELEAFFAQIDTSTLNGKRDRALFLTLLCTGRRKREITLLRRGDLERMTFLEQGRTRVGWTYQYLGKHRVTKETAEMPSVCVEAIRQFHAAYGLDFDTEPPEQPLFFGVAGPAKSDQPMALSSVNYRFEIYARAAGISEDTVVHSLRYEYAWQRYQENGHDALEVQDAVGWKSIEQTLHYIKRRKRKQRGDPMAEKMSARFAHL